MLSRYRKFAVIGAGLALLVGLTAGPLDAGSSTKKTYSVTVNPTSLPATTPTTSGSFTVTYANTTPGGTSTINSLTLTAPTGYTLTSAPTLTASSGNPGNYNISVSSTAPQTITVTNLNPLTYQQSVTLSFSASVDTTNLTCSTVVGTWATTAWTGSNTSGTLFTLSSAAPTTTIGTGTPLLPGGSTSYVDANGNTVTVTNLSTSPCAVPVSISRTANTTTITKPTVAGVGLTADIVWDPEPAVTPLPPTQVDTPSPTHDILWCGGTASAPTLPSTEVSCLVSESSQIAGSNTVQVHDLIYMLGDISYAR